VAFILQTILSSSEKFAENGFSLNSSFGFLSLKIYIKVFNFAVFDLQTWIPIFQLQRT